MAFERVRGDLLAYRVYAPSFLHAHICTESGRVEAGAIIVQSAYIGPLTFEMAVRVTELLEEDSGGVHRTGFHYETLVGHLERGGASFIVEHDKRQSCVRFRIESWSEPGHWITRFLRPISRRMQVRANEEALALVARST